MRRQHFTKHEVQRSPVPANQRRAEVLRAYAERPVGLALGKFLAKIDIPRQTWYEWMRFPQFRGHVELVDRKRREEACEPVHRDLKLVVATVVQEAIDGDMSAARLVLEVEKLVGGASVEINQAFAVLPAPEEPRSHAEMVEALKVSRDKTDRLLELADEECGERSDASESGNGRGGAATDPPGSA